ncbi:MAG: Fe-S cluster assembly protein SufD [Legionella sp.]|nr:Fe-S cluster assembly protein SufD [Legionella sp.]
MSDILEFYQEQAKAGLSTIPWLALLQKNALNEFNRYAFPTRKDEDWKYTAMDGFLQHRFAKFSEEAASDVAKINADIPIGRQLVIHNGQVVDVEKFTDKFPAGVIVKPLLQAMEEHADKIKPYLDKLLKHEHGFHALNMAALQTGVLIYVPKGVLIEEPIVLAHWQDKANQAVHSRHLIIAEEGSQATIIETFHGMDACNYLTNTVTEVQVGKNAKIIHYKIQCESHAAFHIGHLTVQQESESQFDSHSLSLGGKLVRSDLTFNLQELRAQCLMNGIYIPTDQQHVDHHTTVHHLVPDCSSTQDYKGILTGKSRAVFNGKVVVAKDAQHTRAAQQNKNLILSALAEIDTKPQLEIFADDVLCSHGATVGQLDEDALFYMATRGIDREDASCYLIHAFAADNLRLVPHPEMVNWMSNLITRQLR